MGDRSASDLTLSAAQKADLVIQASYKSSYKSDYKSDHELTNGKRKSVFRTGGPFRTASQPLAAHLSVYGFTGAESACSV